MKFFGSFVALLGVAFIVAGYIGHAHLATGPNMAFYWFIGVLLILCGINLFFKKVT